MKLSLFEITPDQFYKLGIISFIIIGLCSLASMIIHFSVMDIFAVAQSSVFTLFYFGTALFFNYLRNIQKVSVSSSPESEVEMSEILKELNENKSKARKK